jgi:hypothetical protein
MKDGVTRNKIIKDERVIYFEMEIIGLINNFPYLVIKGRLRLCRLSQK